MSNVSSFVRGLLISGVASLTVASVAGCVESKDELDKGEVDESSPPGSPEPLLDGKSDGGTTFAVALDSAHPYSNNLVRTYTADLDGIVPSCTRRVRAHFAGLRAEANYDFVNVLAPDGSVVQSLTGNRDGVWSSWVDVTPGALALNIQLDTDYSITDYGFRVDAVEVETAVNCPLMPILACDPGYFDVTPTPGLCECRGETQCAEDGWVEIEHAIGGGFTGAVSGRRLVGQTAHNTSYSPGEPDDSVLIGTLDRAAVQELIHAIVDSGILDRTEVEEPSNWNETFSIRLGTRAVSFTRPQGTFPADEAALIARFEELFTCGGAGTALTCGADFTCASGACVADEGCVCPALYDPVCGADGRTYGNACNAGCANVAVDHDGECGIAGDLCGGLGAFACQDAFKCRYGTSTWEAPSPDAAGSCVAETYCDAPADCSALPHIAVPGTWACQTNSCAWVTGPAWTAVSGWSFSTTHPYSNNANVWQALYLPAGATKMRLDMTGVFNLETNYDKLEVWTWRTGAWVKVKTYTGTVGPAASEEFAGQYHYLHFVSDSSVTKHGFDLTAQYAQN
jgi:hypothetical protein